MRILLAILAVAVTLTSAPVLAQDIPDLAYVQRRLFDLGYYDGVETGVMDDAARQAIMKAQSDIGEAPTGHPSELLLFGIRFKVAQGPWGAVAVAADGVYSVAVAMQFRRDARDQVVRECESRTKSPGTCHWKTIWAEPGNPNLHMMAFHCENTVQGTYHGVVVSADSYETDVALIVNHVTAYGYTRADCREISTSSVYSIMGGGRPL
jgi:hypothetical protein